MTALTTEVVLSYTRLLVRSRGGVGVGSSFCVEKNVLVFWRSYFCDTITFTINCLSSEPDEMGVEDLSVSTKLVRGLGVLGGLSVSAPTSPSEESECSEPKEWVMDSLFFYKIKMIIYIH